MKTLRASKQTEMNQEGKIPRQDSQKQTISKLKTTRNGRIIKNSSTSEERKVHLNERRIPMLAEAAMSNAYRRALASGSTVLIAEAGQLKEVSPDGTKRVIKKIEPSIKMQKGLIIKIK
jgi:hypothetical protein